MAAKKVVTNHEAHLGKRLNLLAAALIVIIAARYIASAIIAPILIAAMFAVMLMPIFKFYKNHRIPKNISLVLMVITVIGGAYAIIWLLQYSFTLISASIDDAFVKAGENISHMPVLNYLNTSASSSAQTAGISGAIFSEVNTVLANVINFLYYLLIISMLSVLLVSQIDSFSEGFKEQLGKAGPSLSKYRKFAESINASIIGRFKINLITVIFLTPALFLMGVDYPILWGFLTMILSFIPYVGIVIAGIGPFLIMVAKDGIPGGLLVILVYTVINVAAENFVAPWVLGKQNRLTAASLIIGFIFWTWFFGILGAIMAAPLTVMLKTILEDYKETKWISMLMVGDYTTNGKSRQSIGKIFQDLRKSIKKW